MVVQAQISRSRYVSFLHKHTQLTTNFNNNRSPFPFDMDLKRSQLQDLCEKHGLPKSGIKKVLVDRLVKKGIRTLKRALPSETDSEIEDQEPAEKKTKSEKTCSICDFEHSCVKFPTHAHANIHANAQQAHDNVCLYCWENDIRCQVSLSKALDDITCLICLASNPDTDVRFTKPEVQSLLKDNQEVRRL